MRSFFIWVSQISLPGSDGDDETDSEGDLEITWTHAVFRDAFTTQPNVLVRNRAATTLEDVLHTCQVLTSPTVNEIRSSDTHNNPHLSQQHFFLDTASETAHSLRQCYSGLSDDSMSMTDAPDFDEYSDIVSDDEKRASSTGPGDDNKHDDDSLVPIPGITPLRPLVPTIDMNNQQGSMSIPGIFGSGQDGGGSNSMTATRGSVLTFPTFRGLEGIFMDMKESMKNNGQWDDAFSPEMKDSRPSPDQKFNSPEDSESQEPSSQRPTRPERRHRRHQRIRTKAHPSTSVAAATGGNDTTGPAHEDGNDDTSGESDDVSD